MRIQSSSANTLSSPKQPMGHEYIFASGGKKKKGRGKHINRARKSGGASGGRRKAVVFKKNQSATPAEMQRYIDGSIVAKMIPVFLVAENKEQMFDAARELALLDVIGQSHIDNGSAIGVEALLNPFRVRLEEYIRTIDAIVNPSSTHPQREALFTDFLTEFAGLAGISADKLRAEWEEKQVSMPSFTNHDIETAVAEVMESVTPESITAVLESMYKKKILYLPSGQERVSVIERDYIPNAAFFK